MAMGFATGRLMKTRTGCVTEWNNSNQQVRHLALSAGVWGRAGQEDSKSSALTCPRGSGSNPPAVGFHQAFGNGQSDAGAGLVMGSSAAEKGLKHAGKFCTAQSNTGVGDTDGDPAVTGGDRGSTC